MISGQVLDFRIDLNRFGKRFLRYLKMFLNFECCTQVVFDHSIKIKQKSRSSSS